MARGGWLSLRFQRSLTPLIVIAAVLTGCQGGVGLRADVGECDPSAARQIVYRDVGDAPSPFDGTPMFAGQALLHTSCADLFCHSPTETTTQRYGTPAHLFFNVGVPCDDAGCLPGAIETFRARQANVFEHRELILGAIDRGTMPPGDIGDQLRYTNGRYVVVDTDDAFFMGGVEDGIPLPDIESSLGREIVRNWLACGAPVVERFESPEFPTDSGRFCRGSTDCVVRVDSAATIPEPNWPSIYETLIFPFCGSTCHGPGEPDFREESQLDLSDIELAYDSMVNVAASGEECATGASPLVLPGDSAGSLLLNKMVELAPSCGDPMPSGLDLFPPEFTDVIAQWIDAGAPEAPAP